MNKKIFLSLMIVFSLAFSSFASDLWSFDEDSMDVNVTSLGLNSISTQITSTDGSDVNVTSLALSTCGDLNGALVASTPYTLSTGTNTLGFQLNVTASISSGAYVCTLNATDSDAGSDIITLNVNVAEIDDFSISNPAMPSTLNVGEAHNGSFVITNDGNIAQEFTVSFTEKEDYDEDLTLSLTDNSGNALTSGFTTGSLSVGSSYTVNYTFSSDENIEVFHNENMGYNISVVNGNTNTQNQDLVTILGSNEFDVSVSLEPDDELEPGEDFTVEVTIENTENFDMDDVQIEVWVQNIDDTDDLEAESTEFSLGNGDDKTKSFDFEIPYNVDADSYNILVKVTGEDEDDSSNDFKFYELFRNYLTVEKDEDEDVVFLNYESSTNGLMCGESFTAYIDIVNVGEDDLEDMYVKLKIDDLSIEYTSNEFDLDSTDSDDREKQLQFLVTLPSGLTSNELNLKFEAYNEDDDIFDIGYNLLALNCNNGSSDEDDSSSENQEGSNDSTEDNSSESDGVIYYPTGFSVSELFTSDNAELSFWILGNLALLTIVIYFASLIFRKRR